MTQRTLSHGLPLLSRGHPPPLHQPHFLPLMRTHPPPSIKNYSPTPLPPLLNTPLPSSPGHHHSPPHHHAHSPYHPKENNNDVYDVSELMIKLAKICRCLNKHVQVPSNYHFTYHVSDHYSGDVHHHSESKTEQKTEGQYSVKLPDGRTQVSIVNGRQLVVTCHASLVSRSHHTNVPGCDLHSRRWRIPRHCGVSRRHHPSPPSPSPPSPPSLSSTQTHSVCRPDPK